MSKCLRPECGRFIGERGGQGLGLLLKLFLSPQKGSRSGGLGRRSPVEGGRPSTDGGGLVVRQGTESAA